MSKKSKELRVWEFLNTTEGRYRVAEVINAAALQVENAPGSDQLLVTGEPSAQKKPCKGCTMLQPPRGGDHLDGCMVVALRAISQAIMTGKDLERVGKKYGKAFMAFTGAEATATHEVGA